MVIVSVTDPIARGLRTIESLSAGQERWPVVAISRIGDRETIRTAMVAGVRDYVVEPAPLQELHRTVVEVCRSETLRRSADTGEAPRTRLGAVISVFSAKGGVGKSTVTINVAVALAQETQLHVALVDLDLQFGDTALMLDVTAKSTIAEAAVAGLDRNPQALVEHLIEQPSSLTLLAAPKTPEDAADLSPDDVGSVPRSLAAMHNYVVVDNSVQLDSVIAMAMDLSTMVLLLVFPEVPALRRTHAALKLMKDSGYSRAKLKVVVNRVHRNPEISVDEIHDLPNYGIYAEIPEVSRIRSGLSPKRCEPAAVSRPKRRHAKPRSR